MNKIQKKRLLNVARALREAGPDSKKTFSMLTFGYSGDESVREVVLTGTSYDRPACGTPACALGHYAVRGDLQKKFKLSAKSGRLVMKVDGSIPLFGDSMFATGSPISRHFGLIESELELLFNGYGCGHARTPIQAARFIEKFVAKKA